MICLFPYVRGRSVSYTHLDVYKRQRKCWYDAIDEASEMVDDTVTVDIQGYDIDAEVIKAARENAKRDVYKRQLPFALFGVRSSAKLVRDLDKHRRTPMSPPQLKKGALKAYRISCTR